MEYKSARFHSTLLYNCFIFKNPTVRLARKFLQKPLYEPCFEQPTFYEKWIDRGIDYAVLEKNKLIVC